jgi:hypothetical protein
MSYMAQLTRHGPRPQPHGVLSSDHLLPAGKHASGDWHGHVGLHERHRAGAPVRAGGGGVPLLAGEVQGGLAAGGEARAAPEMCIQVRYGAVSGFREFRIGVLSTPRTVPYLDSPQPLTFFSSSISLPHPMFSSSLFLSRSDYIRPCALNARCCAAACGARRGLRVRMGLHTGITTSSDVTFNPTTSHMAYSGTAMKVARAVGDAAAGGMILMSQSTFQALVSMLMELPGMPQVGKGARRRERLCACGCRQPKENTLRLQQRDRAIEYPGTEFLRCLRACVCGVPGRSPVKPLPGRPAQMGRGVHSCLRGGGACVLSLLPHPHAAAGVAPAEDGCLVCVFRTCAPRPHLDSSHP